MRTPPLTLAQLARRARITRRAVQYHLQRGDLRARRVRWRGTRTRWVVDAAEAERWLQSYTKHARAQRPATRRVAA